MAVWVSGASGRLGRAVVARLSAEGVPVIAVDRAQDGESRWLDLLDYAATHRSMAEADVVIHLAAYPSPEGVTPAELLHNNVVSTFNVCEAALGRGIERVVLASSGSIYGYAWSPLPIVPPYLPIDEDTPLAFVDPYALSKELGERIGMMAARRGLSVIALRPHWILREHELRHLRETFDEADGARNLWGYVELGDAARACVLAARADLPSGAFEPLNIAAADTMAARPTEELLTRWFPEVETRASFPERSGAFDCSRAEELLGWKPEFRW